jgi:GDPmannose 4,6-dehydratase
MPKTALILGISGQDGSYLAQLLLSKGYKVHGTSRDVETQTYAGLRQLGILDQVSLHSASTVDFRSLLEVVTRIQPDEIYNLAGQTSVGLSFTQPTAAFESIAIGTIQLLEVLRYLKAPIRMFNSCSSECFGQQPHGSHCDEATPFHPRSPYAMAKAAGYWAVANYREAYDLHACSGILFNHESPLRPSRFVTKKIVATAARIARGEKVRLELGNLDVWRDWGYAPEYVEAMWLMLQQRKPDDFVIATGESRSLQDFLAKTFELLQLDWKKHVDIDRGLFRATDLAYGGGDPAKARKILKWSAKTRFAALVQLLIDAELGNDAGPAKARRRRRAAAR